MCNGRPAVTGNRGTDLTMSRCVRLLFVVAAWMSSFPLFAQVPGRDSTSLRDSVTLSIGAKLIDSRAVKPYVRSYAVYETAPESARARRVASFVDRVRPERGPHGVFERVTELASPGRDTVIERETYDGRTLAPLSGVRRYGGHEVRYTVRGSRVVQYVQNPEGVDTLDSTFAAPAFRDHSEPLLFQAIHRVLKESAVFRLSVFRYEETEHRLTRNDFSIHVVRSELIRLDDGRTTEVWVATFGDRGYWRTYWLRKSSGEVLKWEDPEPESGLVLRYVAQGL
jgi:hypothetical protein